MSRLFEAFLFACAPAIGYAGAYGERMIQYKLDTGFVNREMKITYECYTQALRYCDDNKILDDNHRSIVVVGGNTFVAALDEDTYYFIRWLIWLEQFYQANGCEDIPDMGEWMKHDTDVGMLVYNSGGWELMHRNLKSCIFPAVWAANQIYGGAAKKKASKGFKFESASQFYKAMDFIVEFDEPMRQQGKVDHLRSLYRAVRDAASVMIDDDEQIRKFTEKFYELLLEKRADIRIETHKTRPYFKQEYWKNRDDINYRIEQAKQARDRSLRKA